MSELICCEGAQTSIVQSLTYFEHLSEPMAEFLHILAEQYDYPQLSDEILKYLDVSRITTGLRLIDRRELGNKEFNSNDTRGPKSVSAFIVKLSELAPRLIIKQMTLLAKQLDSEVISPRQSYWLNTKMGLIISTVIHSSLRCC
jgi:condensin complex subunit 1